MMRLGLYEVDIGFSSEGGNGDIMAFADVDSNKFTDMITLNQEGNAIELHSPYSTDIDRCQSFKSKLPNS